MPVKTEEKKSNASKGKKAPDKMLLFAAEYVIDFNGTRAYKEVYGKQLSDNTAAVNASKLLRHTKVCSETERLLAEVKNRRTERKIRVLKGLEEIAYNQSLEPQYRLKGYELLGKTEGMFTEKVEHTGEDGKPIEIAIIKRVIVDNKA